MNENDISFAIRGAAFDVHNYFGPGLFESVYEAALAKNLSGKGFAVERQVGIPVEYLGENLGLGFIADLIVNNKIVVEIKSVSALHDVHYKQLLTYLRLTNLKLGLLINFNETSLATSIKRVVNGLSE